MIWVLLLILIPLLIVISVAMTPDLVWEKAGQQKIVWLLVVLLVPFAWIVYLAAIRPRLRRIVNGASTRGVVRVPAGDEPRDSSQPILEADALTAGYLPGVNILQDCSLTLAEGELVGIIGPNGAGKSTLIKAMFGLVTIHEGQVRLRGEDITNLKAHALVSRGIGYVPQTNNVFPALTVLENLEMGSFLEPRTFKERYDVVGDMFPRLVERKDQRAGALSGGERQMLAMGRALMLDPSVLLLDEPSAGLSPALQDEVFIRCHKINKAGVSIVMVEQNASRCLQICDRGYVLDQGANAYTGTGGELLKDPKVVELYLGTLVKDHQD